MPASFLTRLLPLALAAALAGCGPDKNEFAPPCPQPSFVRGLDDLTRFRTDGGRDLTDMLIQGRLVSLNGECKMVTKKGSLVEATVKITAEFLRGPALLSRQQDVPVFLAVTDGDTVLDKQLFLVPVNFPSNVDRLVLTSPEMRLVLPSTPTKSPAAFGIVAGFQLSPAELGANRQRVGQ